jgi:hypothetical protein
MGSPEKLFTAESLKQIPKAEKKKLADEIKQHLKEEPNMKAIITGRAHVSARLRKNLKKKFPEIVGKLTELK